MKRNDKYKIRLEEVPKETPFTVPEGYFEDFSARLNERLQKEDTPIEIPAEPTIWRGVRSMLGMAAGLAFFVILSFTIIRYILNQNDVNTNKEIAFNDSIRQEGSLNGGENEVSTESVYNDEAINEAYFTDYMMDYLISEGVDIQLLAEEL